MDPHSESLLSAVAPELAHKVRMLADVLAHEHFEIRVTQGLRTWEEQDALFHHVPQVTKAAGGHSWHNFGLAVDVVPDNAAIDHFQCDWNLQHPVWQRIHVLAESIGLTCGADFRSFPDWPHLQLTGRFPVSPNDEVRQIFKDKGIEEVWKEAGL